MTELTDALIEAMAAEIRAGRAYEAKSEQIATASLAALSRVLAERGLKVTGREAVMAMQMGAMNVSRAMDIPKRPLRVAHELHDACVVWTAMHDAAPNLLAPTVKRKTITFPPEDTEELNRIGAAWRKAGMP